jgi:hypothetical protein
MLRYPTADKEPLLKLEAELLMKLLKYVVLFHGNKCGKTF